MMMMVAALWYSPRLSISRGYTLAPLTVPRNNPSNTDDPVTVVEKQACEDLVFLASQADGEEAAGVGGTAQRCVAAQPALDITTPEL